MYDWKHNRHCNCRLVGKHMMGVKPPCNNRGCVLVWKIHLSQTWQCKRNAELLTSYYFGFGNPVTFLYKIQNASNGQQQTIYQQYIEGNPKCPTCSDKIRLFTDLKTQHMAEEDNVGTDCFKNQSIKHTDTQTEQRLKNTSQHWLTLVSTHLY